MIKIFKRFTLALVMLFVVLVTAQNATASHAVGIDLSYVCLGGNQYEFTVSFYRDCSGISAPSSVNVSIGSASCGINSSISLSRTSMQEVSQICSSAIPNTTCNGGNLPGIEQYNYTGTFTLPAQCTDWVASYSLCCRNGGITNLQNPSSQNLYVEATINNTGGNCNSSAQFTSLPVPYICVNQAFSYNHSAVDPDGNTLVYSLVNPLTAAGSPISYVGGYSPTSPISASGTFVFNTITGQMEFTPDIQQQAVVTILIEEYDTGGNLVGSTMRDLQVVVLNCTNAAPTASGIDSSTTVFSYNVCTGTPFCFDIYSLDNDPGQTTTMYWNHGIADATFTVSGSPLQVGSFCWTPQSTDVGTHYFTVTVEDDACQIPGINTYTYQVDVTLGTDPNPNAGVDQLVCAGDLVNLSATSGPGATYNWSPSSSFNCTNCLTPSFNAASTNIYTFTATYTASGCVKSDNVLITVDPDPTVTIFPPTVEICSGSSVSFTANTDVANTYLWSTGETTASITASPGGNTTYTVTVTNPTGCTSSTSASVIVSPPPPAEVCNNIYVTTSGTGTGDTPTDPTDLLSALAMSQCNNATIKMAIGTYTIDNAIVDILGYTTLEGGYDPANNWTKTSLTGATTIFRSTLNPEGPVNAQRLVAIYMNNASYFRFQDLTIQVADAPTTGQEGMSTYALHMTSCSNYDIVRCNLITGAASAGASGTSPTGPGGGGAGGVGGTGGNANQGCNASGAAGANGGIGSGGNAGGAGGAGANGDGCNFLGCNANAIAGGAGANGSAGSNGVNSPTVAPAPNIVASPFYLPNAQSTSGGNGGGGAGGGGGGGASKGSSCFCSYFGTGNGGVGGAGGAGGAGGLGGFAGGGSFGIYTSGNLTGGNIEDVAINQAPISSGGAGGVGALGVVGAAGGAAQTAGCGGNSASSGAGGTGGTGGAGGNGQPGANGRSSKIVINGTIPTLTKGGTAINLIAGENNPIDFNLVAQPEIFMTNKSCTNVDVNFSSATASSWNLATTSTNQNPSGASVINQYTDLGRKNIQFGSAIYTGFANITLDGVLPADMNTSATQIGVKTFTLCAGDNADFWTTTLIANAYSWNFDGAVTPNTYTTESVNGLTFNTPGTYNVQLAISTDCCGPASPDTIILIVEEIPSLVINGTTSYCEGGNTQLIATSPSDSIIWSPNSSINIDTGHTVTFNPSVTSNYIATAYSNLRYCTTTQNVTIQVNPLPNLTTSSTNVNCLNDGTASVSVTNIAGPFTYQWNDVANQTTTPAVNLFSGNYEVVVTDQATSCADSTYVFVSPGTSPLVYIQSTSDVSCYLGSDGTAIAAVSNGASPFTYTWNNTDLGTIVASGVGITTVTGLIAGNYNVSVVDGNACITNVDFSITQPDTALFMFSVDTITTGCDGSLGGLIATADGGSGGYSYLWAATASNQTTATVTGLSVGNYSVTVTDIAGCAFNGTYGVVAPVAITVVANSTITSCNGGSDGVADGTAINGNAPYTYLWDATAMSQTTAIATGLFAGTYTVTITDASACYGSITISVGEPTAISVTGTSVNANCALADGSASVISTGGTSPYIYLWDISALSQTTQTATGIVVGNYIVTTFDNNLCENTTTITVGMSSPVMTTISSSFPTLCNGSSDGSATITPTSGTTPYTFLWQNGQTTQSVIGVSAGNYLVTITDNDGCIGAGNVSVSEPTAISLLVNSTDETCTAQDGTATVIATGGSTSYTYQWSTTSNQTASTATGLAAGNYTVTVLDNNNCTQVATVTVGNVIVTLTATTSVTDVSCYQGSDGTSTITPIGGSTPYTYTWFDGSTIATISGLPAGEYTYSVSDASGCSLANANTPTPIAGCVQITSILVDACINGTNEWDEEMVFFQTGATPLNVADLNVTWHAAANTWNSTCTNPTWIANVNASIIGGGQVIVPTGGVIPPNSQVLLLTSSVASSSAMSFANLPYTLYVIFQCPGNSQGHFGNYNSSGGARNLALDFGAGCADNVSYDRGLLPNSSGGFGGPSASKDGAYVSFSASGAITYGNNGCVAPYDTTIISSVSAAVTITEPTALSVTVATTEPSCFGFSNGTATVTVSGGTSGYTYLWDNAQTNSTTTGLAQNIGNITVLDANLCSVVANYTITEPTALSITMNQSDLLCNAVCEGAATATITGGITPYLYSWTSGQTGSTSTGLCAQTEAVTVLDANSCFINSSVTLSEPTLLTMTFQALDVTCFNGSDGFSVVVTGGGTGAYTYLWGGGIVSANPFAGNLSAGTYSLTVVDANNCRIDTTNFIINQPAIISVTAFAITPSNCSSPDGAATVTSVVGGTGSVYTYNWSNGQMGATISGVTDGQYCVTVTDQQGCSEAYCTTVTAISGPSVFSQSTAVTCNADCDGIATATAIANGGSTNFTYQWDSNTGNQILSSATGLCSGTYSVTATDVNGCKSVTITSISTPSIVEVTPTAIISTVCEAQCIDISANANGGNGAPYSYVWNVGGGQTQNVCPTTSSFYAVTATDVNGCVSLADSILINIYPALSVTAASILPICENTTVTLNASAVGGNGGPYIYFWNNGGGNGDTVLVVPNTYPLPMTYVVNVSDGCSPIASDTVNVSFYPTPKPLFTATDFSGCQPFTSTIYPLQNSVQNISACTWVMDDGTVFNGCDSVIHTFNVVGTHGITLNVVSSDGCSGSFTNSTIINVYELPVASFISTPNPTTLYETLIKFEDSSSGQVNQWNWVFYDADSTAVLSNSTVFNPFLEYPAKDGVYPVLLHVETIQGCVDDTIGALIITPVYQFYIPNAFTPNRNGLNDVFKPVGLNIDATDYHFMVFDRWGGLIFETKDLNEGWDGTDKFGTEYVANDVYVWKILTRKNLAINDKQTYVGHVTVIR